MGTTQLPVPVQAPLQPENVEPLAAAAVKVTAVPNVPTHVAPQLIPAGLDVMVPAPAPVLVTGGASPGGAGWRAAVTFSPAALIVTEQVAAVPVQAPLQLVNVDPPAGVAVRVTTVPLA